jgi:isopenicillin N synthase-like dioxygenase
MTEALPIIDVGAFLEKRADAGATAREIEKACRDFGFFYATGHGVGGETSTPSRRRARASSPCRRRARWRSRSRTEAVPGAATFL